MAKKARHFFKYLLVSFLTLIGFSSCSKADLEQGPEEQEVEEDILVAYGSPMATLQINAKVEDASGNPVNGARMFIRYGKDPYALTTIPSPGDKTTSSGIFTGWATSYYAPDKNNTYLVFRSKLNSDLAEKFADDSVKIIPQEIKKGDGAWDQGTFKIEGTLKLKEKPAAD